MFIKSMQRPPLRRKRKKHNVNHQKQNRKGSRSMSGLPESGTKTQVFALTETTSRGNESGSGSKERRVSHSRSSRLIDQARRGSVSMGLVLDGGQVTHFHFAEDKLHEEDSIGDDGEDIQDREESTKEVVEKGKNELKRFAEFRGTGVDTSSEAWLEENAKPEKYFGKASANVSKSTGLLVIYT